MKDPAAMAGIIIGVVYAIKKVCDQVREATRK